MKENGPTHLYPIPRSSHCQMYTVKGNRDSTQTQKIK